MNDIRPRNEMFRTLPIVEAGIGVAVLIGALLLLNALLVGPETHVQNVVDNLR